MDDADVGRAPLIGVSIGGYALFEFWRKYRARVAALGLCNTKAPADNPEARAGRLQAAKEVLERGTEPFFEAMIPKLMGKTTREMRPDLVDGALRMMRKMSPRGCRAGAARDGGASGLSGDIEDHQCSNAADHRRRRHHDRRERSGNDAPAHFRQPDASDSEGRTLFALGAARSWRRDCCASFWIAGLAAVQEACHSERRRGIPAPAVSLRAGMLRLRAKIASLDPAALSMTKLLVSGLVLVRPARIIPL